MLRDKSRFTKSYPSAKESIKRPVIVSSIGGFFVGKPASDQYIFYYVSNRKIEFKNNFIGSYFSSLNASTAQKTFQIYIQNSFGHNHVANIVINAGNTQGIISTLPGANQHLNVGDSIYIKAPTTQDLTLSDLTISLAGDLIP
jgi:hypothetical protein